jgi:hypothetical protein
MATLEVKAAAPDFVWWPAGLDDNGPTDIFAASATDLKYTSKAGFVITLSGTEFDLTGGIASAGSVTSLTVRDSTDTTVLMTITDFSISFHDLYYTLFGGDDGSGGGSGPNPFGALEAILSGSDMLLGSTEVDQIGGYSPGGDVIQAFEGDDVVAGDSGGDNLNGGSGFDMLTYYQSIFDSTAFRGIDLDVQLGTAIDPWGDTDYFVGFEEFDGSPFNDVMKGSSNTQFDEDFRGLAGNDYIDGRAGWDNVVYSFDAFFGGNGAIHANLTTGLVTDAWGDTDTVTGVEGVFGTAGNDSFIGNNSNNLFQGLAGVDTFSGKGGFDGSRRGDAHWSS